MSIHVLNFCGLKIETNRTLKQLFDIFFGPANDETKMLMAAVGFEPTPPKRLVP